MRYLCLIYLNEKEMDALPGVEMARLDAGHIELNDSLRKSGHFIEAEALEPSAATACVRIRNGKPAVTDGPFAQAREPLAGFYLIEARDLNEAIRVAANFPSARLATVEVRAVRRLEVEGRSP